MVTLQSFELRCALIDLKRNLCRKKVNCIDTKLYIFSLNIAPNQREVSSINCFVNSHFLIEIWSFLTYKKVIAVLFISFTALRREILCTYYRVFSPILEIIIYTTNQMLKDIRMWYMAALQQEQSHFFFISCFKVDIFVCLAGLSSLIRTI